VRTPAEQRVWSTAAGTVRLDLLYGDFAAAEHNLGAWEHLAASDADENSHAQIALVRLALAEEAQQSGSAGEIAKAFVARREVWGRARVFDETPLIDDPLVTMVAAEARAGLVGPRAVEQQRAKWIGAWRSEVTPTRTGFLWLHGWAVPASTAEDARAALDAQSQFAALPLPVKYVWAVPGYEAHAGKVLLLAGRAREALEPLERGAAACDGIEFPVEKVRAYLWLGQAREASGDTAGACAAYSQVVARWGAAKARSVTARSAIERAAALHCK
jgi:serine/threonine-protein kinase